MYIYIYIFIFLINFYKKKENDYLYYLYFNDFELCCSYFKQFFSRYTIIADRL